MNVSANRALWLWVALGGLAYLLLPWYAIQETNGLAMVPQVFGGERTGNGLLQAAVYGRPWLWLGLAGGGLGLLALLASGFLIGARGWTLESLAAAWGELGARQPGVGWGGFVALAALMMLTAFGLARRGRFKGDLFVAAAVVACASLLALFIVFPVAKALRAAFLSEDGRFAFGAIAERVASERNFGLACLAGGERCGVAWNTLFLGLMTATSTTVLGTLMALMAERTSSRYGKPLNVVALLPIITPPFMVGLGLILLFGRAGVANQLLEYAFGITPTRWFYGWFGVWIAQTSAFTPIAFMIMRGVVQGVSPSLEEAAQTLRANANQTFLTVALPLLTPGLANAFLVGFIESMADFGNPIVVGGQFSVLSTEIFFAIVGAQYDQGRAASLAWILTVFALTVFVIQRALLGRQNFTTVSGKGDAGVAMPLPRAVRRVVHGVALPWMAFTLLVYLFAFASSRIVIAGKDVTTLGPAGRNVSMMFQRYALFPHMSVVENVTYGLRMSGMAKAAARTRGGWRRCATSAWSAMTSERPANFRGASSSASHWRAPWCWSRPCCRFHGRGDVVPGQSRCGRHSRAGAASHQAPAEHGAGRRQGGRAAGSMAHRTARHGPGSTAGQARLPGQQLRVHVRDRTGADLRRFRRPEPGPGLGMDVGLGLANHGVSVVQVS